MHAIHFEPLAYQDFIDWSNENLELFQKITILIKDIERDPFKGLGKPEPLKKNLQGFWSRRINDEHGLIYRVNNEAIRIISCHGHYTDFKKNQRYMTVLN